MSKVLTSPAEVTPDYLTRVLRDNDLLPRGEVSAIKTDKHFRAVSTIATLHLSYTADSPSTAPARIIFKAPRFLDRVRDEEVIFYTQIAPMMNAPFVIRCYDAVYDSKYGEFHLLLEDLSETHDSHPPSQLPPPLAHSELIVDALAQFHAFWWDHAKLGDVSQMPAEKSVREDFESNVQTYNGFEKYLGDRLSNERRRIYDRVIEHALPKVIARFGSGKHLTLIHGDPHIGNFLYPKDLSKDTLRIVDWKSWEAEIGARDLAHKMAMFWYPERRRRFEVELLRRYHRRLMEFGVKGYDWDGLWYDYRLNVIRLLFHPVWQWGKGTPIDIWSSHVERLMCAFEDLRCEELL